MQYHNSLENAIEIKTIRSITNPENAIKIRFTKVKKMQSNSIN